MSTPTLNLSEKAKTEQTLRINPADAKDGKNSRMIAAANYLDNVTKVALSIAKNGQIQPAVVRKLEDNTVEMVAGYTRRDAVAMLREGFTVTDTDTGEEAKFHDPKVLLWVKVTNLDPSEAFVQSIRENQDREDTTDLQEALAQSELRTTLGWTDTKIARLYGYTNQNRVMNLSQLLCCPKEIQNAVHEGRMALSVAILGEKHDLTAEEQLALLESSSDDGKVSGPAYKQLLRALLEKKGTDLPPATPEPEGTPAPEGKKKDPWEEPEEKAPKTKTVKRTAKDFERFFSENKEDPTAFTDNAAELAGVIVLWLAGKRTDEYLRNKFNEYAS